MGLSVAGIIFYAIIILLLCGVASASFFQRKGRSKIVGFLSGLFLGPIGVVLALVFPNDEYVLAKKELKENEIRFSRGILKKCPYCAEYIKKEAVICHYCGRSQVNGFFIPVRKPHQDVLVEALVQNVASLPVQNVLPESTPLKRKRINKKDVDQVVIQEVTPQQYNPEPVDLPESNENNTTNGKKKNFLSKLLSWLIYEQ
jgi:hypothetical protein